MFEDASISMATSPLGMFQVYEYDSMFWMLPVSMAISPLGMFQV